ncbi:MAG: T9SS type A sorting domain-containing protein, partial [Bacteroidales bacterium]|nr:T9SS type A sorting domain-containing protein [Bacteroidales bacterium]
GTDVYMNSALANGDVVSCEVTSSIECTVGNPVMSNEVMMVVNDILPVGLSIETEAGYICDGDEVTFTAIPENGGDAPVYQWMINGNPVGDNSTEFTTTALAQGDVVSCELTSNETCISGNPAMSNAMEMEVNPYPAALEMPTGPNDIDVYETASSSYSTSADPNATAYNWTVNPEDAFTELNADMNNLTITWSEDFTGEAAISVFATNDCGDGPISDNFDVSVMNTFSIIENDLNIGVSVFPNPNNGSFTIKLSSEHGQVIKMQIRSILGEVIFSEEELKVDGEYVKESDLSNYAEGIYFLLLENNNKVLTEKIVVQK